MIRKLTGSNTESEKKKKEGSWSYLTDDAAENKPHQEEIRLDLIKDTYPDITICDKIGEGDFSVVYDCILDDGTHAVLKINKMLEGVKPNELLAFDIMDGVSGIPRVLKKLKDNQDTIIAIIVEKIEGVSLNEYLNKTKMKAVLLLKILELIKEFHSRGFLMPHDWMKNENWIITKEGQPYLIDLGEAYLKNDNKNEIRTMQTDFQGFLELFDKYEKNISWGWKEIRTKSKIKKIIYQSMVMETLKK